MHFVNFSKSNHIILKIKYLLKTRPFFSKIKVLFSKLNIILAFLLLPLSIFSVDSETVSSAENTQNDWRKSNETFYLQTLARELNNADYNDLKQRSMALGLAPKDTAGEYRTQLAEYYGIKLISEKTYTGDKIILEHAGELKMIKLQKENEENLHIIGKAKIIINTRDNEGKSSRREIEADEIFVDLKNKELSGIGNVKYRDDNLDFNGIQFFYNYGLNRGALLNGKTKIKQKDQSGLDGAFFIGERIAYLGEEESILYNGRITTCDEEEPHYSIQVKRLWLNKDSEWGLLGGVAYVGPIPFLYIPVYYHPKSIDLNPSIGYRNREGWFLQTTYSLIGESNINDNVNASTNLEAGLSSRRAAPKSDALFTITKSDMDKWLNDFYDSHPFYAKHPKWRKLPETQRIDLSLKLFADAYTNIGFYYGASFYAKIEHPKFPFEINLLTDYGFSRRLWKDTETDLYIPYNPADKPLGSSFNWDTVMDNTYFNWEKNPLFFRTSQYLTFNGELFKNVMNFRYKGQLEYVSDTSFFRDYYNRATSFSYIDLALKAVTYLIESNEAGNTIFKTKDEEKASKITSTSNFLSFSFSPKKIPDLFGLRLLNNFTIEADATANFTAEAVEEYSTTKLEIGEVEDPRSERLFIDTFSAPKVKVSFDGTLLDYQTFIKMKDTIKSNKNTQKEEKNKKDLKVEKELYQNIDNITLIDASTDKQEIDYKYLLPFFGKKLTGTSTGQVSSGKVEGYYEKIYSNGENKIEMPLKKEEKEKEKEKSYEILSTFDRIKNSSSSEIKFIDFSLKYSFSDTLENKFSFYKKAKRNDPELDNVAEILTGNFDFKEKLMRFSLNNNASLSVNGSFSLLKFANASSPILGLSPNFTLSWKKYWDDMDIFNSYLEKLYSESTTKEASILSDRLAREYDNRNNSELSLKYSDTMTNDISFGLDLLKGSNIKTTLNLDLFTYNEQTSFDFNLLNRVNNMLNTENYEEIDSDRYFTRRGWVGIFKNLYSTFTLKFNIFDTESPHTLDFSLAPKVNWIIPSSSLDSLKAQLWEEEVSSLEDSSTSPVKYTWSQITDVYTDYEGEDDVQKTNVGRLTNAAKEYLYYRTNGRNLNDLITEYYKSEHFWDSEKNFRNIFENLNFSSNYSYKKNSTTIINFSNTFTVNLANIGEFASGKGDESVSPFTVYPDEKFSVSFFNSLFTYSMGLSFSKEVDRHYSGYTTAEKRLDKYNLITTTNTHNFSFTLSNSLFDIKLPKGNWLSFSSATTLKYNKNRIFKSGSNNATDSDLNNFERYFYLQSQTFSLNILMDIMKFNLTLKPYEYVEHGYKIAIESGNISFGYNITEIPTLFNILNVTFNPAISLNFAPFHDPYWTTSGTVESTSQNYYDNNTLNFSFSMDLTFGKGSDYETTLHFATASKNKKMYQYYDGTKDFFDDLGKSFNFASEADRRESDFNLQKIEFSLAHKLHDWALYFEYSGAPTKDSTGKKYIWENTFIFQVTWQIDSKNQLMKLFNKTKVDQKYQEGEWVQPSMSMELEE